jgi:hypothetical protein
MEFQSLKSLINNINNDLMVRVERNRLRVALHASQLRTLIFMGAVLRIGVTEILHVTSAGLARQCYSSKLDDWANKSTMLFKETIAYKAAVQAIQEDYFESHPIMYKDIETEIEMIIQTVRELIATFNDYRKDIADLSDRESNQEQQEAGTANAMPFEPENGLPIDIEAISKRDEIFVQSIVEKWVMNAKVSGIADILRQTGKHEVFVWHHFQKEMGL